MTSGALGLEGLDALLNAGADGAASSATFAALDPPAESADDGSDRTDPARAKEEVASGSVLQGVGGNSRQASDGTRPPETPTGMEVLLSHSAPLPHLPSEEALAYVEKLGDGGTAYVRLCRSALEAARRALCAYYQSYSTSEAQLAKRHHSPCRLTTSRSS